MGRLLLDIAPRIMRLETNTLSNLEIPLTHRQYRILWRAANGHHSPTRMSRAANISLAAISESVEALCRRELLVRTHDPHDRRASHLTLTDQGRGALAAAEHALDDLAEQLTHGLPRARKEALDGSLHHLARNVTAHHARVNGT